MKSIGPLKVAVVGCGFIAQLQHLPSLSRIKNAEVVAVCDQNKDIAESISKKFHIAKNYTDFSEMLDRVNIDMVDICAPPQTHLALSIQAIEPPPAPMLVISILSTAFFWSPIIISVVVAIVRP